jgi:hypothetical protein
LAHCRAAYNDIRPHSPPRMPFIYWDPDVMFQCAAKLIARSPLLQVMADHYDRRNDLAKKWGQVVRTAANNERSGQIRIIKAIWLNNASPLSLVQYDDHDPPRVEVSDAVANTALIADLDALRDLLYSDQFLTNPVLYDLLCAGLESGNFKSTSAMPISTISALCTPSHEAHLRSELWFTVCHYDYRHSISKTHARIRIAKWKTFLPLVHQDRADHEEAAHLLRLQRASTTGVVEIADPPMGEMADNADEVYW